MATLSERISEAITTSQVSVGDVAQRCGITVQAVYQWMNGETRQIMGDYLVELADLTGYEARWIAKELGPKHRTYAQTPQQEYVLRTMEKAPEVATMISKIVNTIADPTNHNDDGGDGNSGRAAAA